MNTRARSRFCEYLLWQDASIGIGRLGYLGRLLLFKHGLEIDLRQMDGREASALNQVGHIAM